jgi:hypothetical protein
MLPALCLPGSCTLFLELASLRECACALKMARMKDCLKTIDIVDGDILLGFYGCDRMPKLGSWALSNFSPIITGSYNVFPAVVSALLGSLKAFPFL